MVNEDNEIPASIETPLTRDGGPNRAVGASPSVFRVGASLVLLLSVVVFGGLLTYPIGTASLLAGSSFVVFLTALIRPDYAVGSIVFAFAMIPMVPTNLGIANASMPSYFLLAFASGRAVGNFRRPERVGLSGAPIDVPLILMIIIYWISCAVTIARYTLWRAPVFFRDFIEMLPRVFFYREADLFLTFSAALQFTLGAIFFYSLLGYVMKEGRRRVYVLMYAALIPIMFFSFYQVVTHKFIPDLWRQSGRINGTFPDPNSFGTYLAAMVFLFGISGRRVLRLGSLGYLGMVVIGLGVLLTSSRAAWAGSFFGLVILGRLWFLRYWMPLRLEERGRRLRKAAVAACIFGLLVFAGGYQFLLGTEVVERQHEGGITNRVLTLFNRSDTFNHVLKGRPTFWYTALNMTKQYPLTGVGVGLFREMMPCFLEEGQSYWWDRNKENAHNQFLQVSGETGIPGLFVFVWLCIGIYYLYRGSRGSKSDYEVMGPAFALLVFGITALGAHPLIQMEIQILFWILVALSVSLYLSKNTSEREPSRSSLGTKVFVGVLIVGYMCAGVVAGRNYPSYFVYDLGMNGWEGERWEKYFRWTKASSVILLPRQYPFVRLRIGMTWPGMSPEHSVSFRYQTADNPPVLGSIKQFETEELTIDMTGRTGGYVPFRIWVDSTWDRTRLPGSTDDRSLGLQVYYPFEKEYPLGTVMGLDEAQDIEGLTGRRLDGHKVSMVVYPEGGTVVLPVHTEARALGIRAGVYAGVDLLGEIVLDNRGWQRYSFDGDYRLDRPLVLTFLLKADTPEDLVQKIALGTVAWLP